VQPVAFIGDELTATGFRLAGAAVFVVAPAEAADALEAARAGSELVLIAAGHARSVDPDVLDEALRSVRPLTVVVEDILSRQPPPDLERAMRRALGVEIA